MKLFVFNRKVYTAKQLQALLKKRHAKLVGTAGHKRRWAMYTNSLMTGKVIGEVREVHVN